MRDLDAQEKSGARHVARARRRRLRGYARRHQHRAAPCGFDADAVYGGRLAIDATARCKPDVALLDIWMPEMSGLEVGARLRADEHTSGTILIAHSAAASEADLERAKQAGFDAFCAKPTHATTFTPLLRHFVPGPVA